MRCSRCGKPEAALTQPLNIDNQLDMVKHMLNDSPVLDRAFHALADASRRRMVDRLSLGPASVSELAGPLDMSLAAVLEASGLTAHRRADGSGPAAWSPPPCGPSSGGSSNTARVGNAP
jgi:hypothetical protein